jgi:hypothetical protein
VWTKKLFVVDELAICSFSSEKRKAFRSAYRGQRLQFAQDLPTALRQQMQELDRWFCLLCSAFLANMISLPRSLLPPAPLSQKQSWECRNMGLLASINVRLKVMRLDFRNESEEGRTISVLPNIFSIGSIKNIPPTQQTANSARCAFNFVWSFNCEPFP